MRTFIMVSTPNTALSAGRKHTLVVFLLLLRLIEMQNREKYS